ncbi:hypothetical protein [Eudoraea adriatica]|uniref:hypothetical protein n=1 Tax=Eudoraea adriatica TaxID=446681 RepID=UPI000372BD26|nr:hypothetical protein [Eudoraea adriatica]
MNQREIYLGDIKAHFEKPEIIGEAVLLQNESFYKISNSNAMRPFFMSIVSDSDHWMFISSNGGLTAGRKNSDSAIFPYYTDDKITESHEITGSKTILKIHKDGKSQLWEPFSERYEGVYAITRNLYKNSYGNKIIFEEINEDLGLTFRYQWNSSDQYGFVKKSTLVNHSKNSVQLTIIDGIQNILPFGIHEELQNSRSNLADAYKKSELEAEIGLGIYALSAVIVDKAEPSEALKSTIAWSLGMDKPTHLISSLQLNAFRKGLPIKEEIDVKAEKSAYFISCKMELSPNSDKDWIIVANLNQGPSDVQAISSLLRSEKGLYNNVLEDIELGTRNLKELTYSADGLQVTADKLQNTRHFANVLFNIMRGGIFDDGYNIEKGDFVKYLEKANTKVYKDNKNLLEKIPVGFSLKELRQIADQNPDRNFKRLCFEYMPLKFSRRHGDPSRPWNKFSINTRSEIDGSKVLDYEGNWRDIFQNWEALAHSYPEFIDSMIHKFLNATTFEGYNPYRVTKDGFDWEIIEPDDPWSYIGYWGDHQIIYLLKFLEFIQNYYPSKLEAYFDQELFVYANVPYKIKSYQDTLKNPKDTIDYDHDLNDQIDKRKNELGADGALMTVEDSDIYSVNLLEKLLATVMSKCSNFIPEGGIWLNTQRPEWNDANNALVGNGVSMVTLYYLRRFLSFFQGMLSKAKFTDAAVSEELVTFFKGLNATLEQYSYTLKGKLSDAERKLILDGLGEAGSAYRANVYANGFSGTKKDISKTDILNFVELALEYLDHSIDANKRGDNMYHAYNLMSVENENEISISYLSEMLEGQVAVLSAGYLNSESCLAVLDGLKASSLFREDQYSYILYPNKDLPRFVDKNNIASDKVEKSRLLKQLIKDGNKQIIEKDVLGNYHFNGSFNNANSLKQALSELPNGEYDKLIDLDREYVLTIFEDVFDHKSFTGRSGTFFGYEGLGSIYWHMVSKLLLAVQECCLKAIENNENDEIVGRLLDHYYEINEGIGVHKSPELYGAFPTDPYSHTPAGKGAQQPGMTGQVKEDILSRIGELGVIVNKGKLQFKPVLLRKEEFLQKAGSLIYTDLNNQQKELNLEENSLGFTYCQIPVIYKLSEKENLKVVFNDDSILEYDELLLDEATSKKVFERTGEINRILVSIKK